MSNYSAKSSQKPLKGKTTISNSGIFNTLTANSLVLENISIAGVYENGIFDSVTFNNGNISNTPIGIDGPSTAFFTKLTTSQEVNFLGSSLNEYVSWDYLSGVFSIGGKLKVDGCSYFDNIEICVNTISATNADGDINLVPNGYGKVFINGPITNISTTGNFNSTILNGGYNVSAYTGVSIGSSHSNVNLSSYSDQNFRTLNGDINLATELGSGIKVISSMSLISSGNAGGLYNLTTSFNHNLRVGDTINISGTGNDILNGTYKVNNIIDDLHFTFTSGNVSVTSGSSGTFTKVYSNNINLLAGKYVTIPKNIPLVFGNNVSIGNSIVNDTYSNLVISSNSNIDLNTSNGSINIPQNINLYFGPSMTTSGSSSSSSTSSNTSYTSGGTITFDGQFLNFNSNYIRNTGALTRIDTTNTKFYDPILTLADYPIVTNDLLDRGIEFKYCDSTTSSLAWFGYKNNINAFTFLKNATNNNEIITGTTGDFAIGNLSLTGNISLASSKNIDVNCGIIKNVNTLSGCGNTLNINGSSSNGAPGASGTLGTVNISTSNILLNAYNNVSIPNNIPLNFGGNSSGSSYITTLTTGEFLVASYNNIRLNPTLGTSVIIPTNTELSLNGSTNGNNIIKCDISGNTIIKSSGDTFISTSNVIVPLSTNIELGDTSKVIYGLPNSLNIVSSVVTNLVSLNNTNILSSIGNVNVSAPNGDILLNTTYGNIKIPQNINFMLGSIGSLSGVVTGSTGTVYLTGSTSGGVSNVDLNVSNIKTINLSAGSSVIIPNNIPLYLGDKSNIVYNKTSGITSFINSNTAGAIVVNSNTVNMSSSSLNINASNTFNVSSNSMYVSTSSMIVDGNTDSSTIINTADLNIRDPNIRLAYGTDNGSIGSTLVDKGILYNTNTSGSSGWFGVKTNTNRFTYYSSATNSNNIISGTPGDFQIGNLYVDNEMSIGGDINLNCHKLLNVDTLSSCNGDIRITSNNIYLSAGNSVQIPYSSLLLFGTAGSYVSGDTYGNLNLNTSNAAGTIFINGNLQVNGTTTNVYSTITNIQDPIISIGGVSGPLVNDAKDRGIEFKWASGGVTKTGFFGFQSVTDRFVFIPDGMNIYEVYYGSYGSVQFNNGYFNNLDISSDGTTSGSSIFGVNNIYSNTLGNLLNLNSNIINLNGNTTIPYNNSIFLGSTSHSISSPNGTSGTVVTSDKLSFNVFNSITVNGTTPIYYGTDGNIYSSRDTSGNYIISNTNGSLLLNSSQSINVLDKIPINFGSTSDQIYSDNKELFLIGYKGINLSAGSITLGGNVNITGNITGISADIDLNRYILPLGTNVRLIINNIHTNTSGNVQISVNTPSYLVANDDVTISNSNSIPDVNGTWKVVDIINPTTFTINKVTTLTTVGDNGICSTKLTVDQGKDVGIQVNYWSTTANSLVTSGSINYKTGFFGYQLSSQNWTFYNDATIANNVVTKGDLGDIRINKLNTNNISGFVLDGSITAGSNAVVGSNFIISGGSIDSTPIGTTIAQSARFSTLSNTVSANLENVTLMSNLVYSFERYTTSSFLQNRNPSNDVVVSFVSVNGVSFNSYGTLGNTSVADGQIKTIACSSMGENCTYTIHVGSGKLIAPNISNNNIQPSKLQFNRSGQSVQMIFDAMLSAWLILGRGCSVF
jgi:hypothetical protein